MGSCEPDSSIDAMSAYAPAAVTTRSGVIESIHHAVLVVLDREGRIDFSIGDPNLAVFPRSSMKPLQTHAMLRNGLNVPDDLLALVCSSHDGRPMHVDGVRRILRSVGLDESALANTADLPLDEIENDRVVRLGAVPTSLQQNCSGKHAGMIATCVAAGWSHDPSYLFVDHPLQREITEGLPVLVGESATAIGVDGCGAPAHVLSLVGLARAFRALATGVAGVEGERIRRAMSDHPEMVGGPRRDVTLLMRGIPGLMAKDGAEGVFAVALPDGRAVALKVADGANRARPPLMRSALVGLGIDVSGVDPAAFESTILGHGAPVGEVRSVGALAEYAEGAT